MQNIPHSDETKHLEFSRPMGGAKGVETNHALICNAAMPFPRKTDDDAARVLSVLNLAPGHLLQFLSCPTSSAAAFMSLYVDACGRTLRLSC